MKPFDTVEQAMNWIKQHAVGAVEVLIFDQRYIMGGQPWNGVDPVPNSWCKPGWYFW